MTSYGYQGNGNVGGTGNAAWFPSGLYSAGTNWLYNQIYTNGEIRNTSSNYVISANGSATFGTSVYSPAFYYSSDKRLKENIVKIADPLGKLKKLNGYTFDWKSNKKHDV